MSMPNRLLCETLPSHEQVLEQVVQIVSEHSVVPREEIREGHLLFHDLGLDSLDLVECSMEIEEEFDISVPDELVEQVKTIANVVDGVLTLLAQPWESD
jgi:acyl carrier protein